MEKELYMRNCPKCGKEIIYSTNRILTVSIKKNKTCRSCSTKRRYSDPKEREKASIIHKKSYLDNPTIKEKLSVSGIKRYSDIKERERTGSISKKIWSNLELRKKASDKSIKFYSNPEAIKKMSEAVKLALNKHDVKEKHKKAIKLALHRPDTRRRHIEALSKVNYLGRATDVGQVDLINKWNKLGFNFKINYQIHTDDFLAYLDGYDKERNVVLEYDSKYHSKLSQQKKDLVRQNKIIEILKPKKFWRYDSRTKQFKNILGKIN